MPTTIAAPKKKSPPAVEEDFLPLEGTDHIEFHVGNVGWHQMNPWVKFYEEVMGFRNILTFDD